MSWPLVNLSTVCQIDMGSAPKGSTYVELDRGVPLIAGAADYGDVFPRPKKATIEPTKLCKKGDIIICVRATIGDLNWADKEYCLGRGVAGLRANYEKLDSKYLWYFIASIEDELYRNSTGSTFPQINKKVIESLKIPLPPLETQKQIAAVLEKADQLRKDCQQMEQELNSLAQSVFMSSYNRVRKSVVSFGDLAIKEKNTFVNGPFGSNLLSSELTDTGVPVLYIRDIASGEFKRKKEVYVTEEKALELDSCRVDAGDVLIAKVGEPPGTAAIYPFDQPKAIVTQDVIRIKCDRSIVLPEYLVAYFNSQLGRHALKAITVEATRSRIGLGDLKKLKVEFPAVEDQLNFVSSSKQLTHLLAENRLLMKEYNDSFNALMQKAFKGELNL
ncbi:restriction endonuclease subunit S [Vibrio paucivorans]